MTGQLTHALWAGVVFAISVVTEAGVLWSVHSLGRADVVTGGTVEADGLSFDDFGIGRVVRGRLIGGVGLWRSQVITFRMGEGEVAKSWRVRANLLIPRPVLLLSDPNG